MATRKALRRVEVKDASKGQIKAVFATLGVVDKDGDVTTKGAFTDGAPVAISAYNHMSWKGALPVGKGTISEVGNEAVFEGQFFLNTQHGRDTFETIKALAEDGGPGAEWSYGFDVEESEPVQGKSAQEYPGARRILRRMKVHEVSPVMVGAGVDTRVLAVKTYEDDYDPDVKRSFTAEERRRLAESGAAMPDGSYPIENRADLQNAIHAVGRGSAPHARIRAHIMRRARSLGLMDLIPADWKKSTFADELKEVVASVESVRERAAEVMAMRAEKGKGLGEETTSLLKSIESELTALGEMLRESEAKNEELTDEQGAELRRIWLNSIRIAHEGV